MIALVAAQKPAGLCGLILVAAPGRKLGDIIREQLRANPANAPLLPDAMRALEALEVGQKVDSSKFPAPLQGLFSEKAQPFLMDLLRQDPPALAVSTSLSMLIVQGGRDIQVTLADAQALAASQPKVRLKVIPRMNHLFKDVASDDRAANLATYGDPSLSVDSDLVDAIVQFVGRTR